MELLAIVMIVSIMMVSVIYFISGKIVDAFCERRIKNLKPKTEKKKLVFDKKKTLNLLDEAIKRKISKHSMDVSELEAWDEE